MDKDRRKFSFVNHAPLRKQKEEKISRQQVINVAAEKARQFSTQTKSETKKDAKKNKYLSFKSTEDLKKDFLKQQENLQKKQAIEKIDEDEDIPEELLDSVFEDVDPQSLIEEANKLNMEEQETNYSSFNPYFSNLSQYPVLTREQEIELAYKIKYENDEKAWDLFVKSNIRLVIACAKRIHFKQGSDDSILSFQDLIQEGILGLLTAVERFDPEKKCKFSTYGIYWIFQKIRRALNAHKRGIMVPCYAGESVLRMKKEIEKYENGELEALPKKVRARLENLKSVYTTWASIDADPEENNGYGANLEHIDGTLTQTDKGSFEGGLEECVATDMLRENLRALLHKFLSKEQCDILARRFGFPPYQVAQSLQEIAEAKNKSKEFVRGAIEKALKELSMHTEIKEFGMVWGIVDFLPGEKLPKTTTSRRRKKNDTTA